VCAFVQQSKLSSAKEAHYNQTHHEHTPRGGGLAMVAGQSCIAGPSVYFASHHVRFLCEPHLPFFRIGNKKGASKREERGNRC
jgi:hypothetical protein